VTTENAHSKTLVTLVLDRSGSMQSIRDDTVGAINSYVGKLRESENDIRFSLVLFDSDFSGNMVLQKVCVAQKISKVKDIGPEDYVPQGGTPLIDAACATIRAVAESVEGRENVRVVIALQTDGQENTSRENSWADLKNLISEKEELGWEFLFMGCGIDAYEQGAMMGISPGKTLSYGKNSLATRAAFEATAINTALYAQGTAVSMDYSGLQKTSAGDKS
jgi:Mg-chelatase subunit ChlD